MPSWVGALIRGVIALLVAGCSSDSEDPGWRQGPELPHCEGTPTACAFLASSTCSLAAGCATVDGKCGGVVSSCYMRMSLAACGQVEGCSWSSQTESCSGSAKSCPAYSLAVSCQKQPDCQWIGACSGVPVDCAGLDEHQCNQQPGCYFVGGAGSGGMGGSAGSSTGGTGAT